MKQQQTTDTLYPKIDARTSAEIYQQAVVLLEQYCHTSYTSTDIVNSQSLELVLLKLFAKLTSNASEWVNKIPPYQQYALIQLLGAALRPPQPAEALLNFVIRKQSQSALVPQGTQVADADDPKVIFETTQDLVVYNTPITQAYSTNYAQNSYLDLTPIIVGGDQGFNILGTNQGTNQIEQGAVQYFEYALYITNFDFDFKTPFNLTLNFEFPQDSIIDQAFFEAMFYAKISESQQFSSWTTHKIDRYLVKLPERLPFDSAPPTFTMEFTDLVIQPTTINNLEGYWLKLESVEDQINLTDNKPNIQKITYQIAASNCVFDAVFVNDASVQPNKGFYLFGKNPQTMDTLYIGANKVFINGVKWQIDIDYLPGMVANYVLPGGIIQGITLVWEYWAGDQWKIFTPEITNVTKSIFSTPETFSTTRKVQTKKAHVLSLSYIFADIQLSTINQVESLWIRCRIAQGNYGSQYGIEPIRAEDTETLTDTFDQQLTEVVEGWKHSLQQGELKDYLDDYYTWLPLAQEINDVGYLVAKPASCFPPYVNQITLNRLENENAAPTPVEQYQSFNQFQYEVFEGSGEFSPYQPYTKAAYLYLAFEEEVAGQGWNAYFSIRVNPERQDVATNQVCWEYKQNNAQIPWVPFTPTLDETQVFSCSGFVHWTFPINIQPTQEFGKNACWIRCSLKQELEEGIYFDGIYPNSVMSENVITINNQLLGSSNGSPNQLFSLVGENIYEGQIIEVKELFMKNSEQTIDENALSADETEERWIPWNAVDSFARSSSHSRDYVIDRVKGAISFGNGEQGRIPPLSKDNIRARLYQRGSNIGDIPKDQITKLLKNIEGISKASNPIAVSEGANSDNTQTLAIQYPQEIAYHGVIVTRNDFEVATKAASNKVAQVHAEVTLEQSSPPKVNIYVLTKDGTGNRYPSDGIVQSITRYLTQRASIELSVPNAIQVQGPIYVDLVIDYLFTSLPQYSSKTVQQNIEDRFCLYFDPLEGREDNQGWSFGETVYLSEVEIFMRHTQGVETLTIYGIYRDSQNTNPHPTPETNLEPAKLTPEQRFRLGVDRILRPSATNDGFIVMFGQKELPGQLVFSRNQLKNV